MSQYCEGVGGAQSRFDGSYPADLKPKREKPKANAPVSQICALIVFCSTEMLLVANSTPIVDLLSRLNSLRVNRERTGGRVEQRQTGGHGRREGDKGKEGGRKGKRTVTAR
jgi:hypothetical protein